MWNNYNDAAASTASGSAQFDEEKSHFPSVFLFIFSFTRQS